MVFIFPNLNLILINSTHMPWELQNEMMPSFIIFRVLLSLCLLSLRIKAAPTFLNMDCPNTTTYTPNSTYQSNLNTLFSDFSSNANPINGFGYSQAGSSAPDKAYGIFLCRGDLSTEVCHDCVVTATQEVLQRCPKSKHVTILYDECLLLYSNQSLSFSKADQSTVLIFRNTRNVKEMNRLREVLGGVMNYVATEASNDQSGKKFATREANFSALPTLYGLAQCTPDLSVSDCDKCLRDAISHIPSCCDSSLGARILFPSCNVRYEFYPFYNVTAAAPPPSPVLPPPNPVPTSSRGYIARWQGNCNKEAVKNIKPRTSRVQE